MKGTEKQIKWANEIKSQIKAGFKKFNPHLIMDKATNYILKIEDASFWIDEARGCTDNPIELVMKFARSGIRIRGLGFGDIAKIDEKTGEIKIEKISI